MNKKPKRTKKEMTDIIPLDKMKFTFEDGGIIEVCKTNDIKTALQNFIKKIKLSQNRDDKVKSQIKIMDMGGIGKQEVYNLLNEIFGALADKEVEE